MDLRNRALTLLSDWTNGTERLWHNVTADGRVGYWGTGFAGWSTQALNQYVGVQAALAAAGEGVPGLDRQRAMDRAQGALRFLLAGHQTGPSTCADGAKWGLTWISVLGIERAMYGLRLILDDLPAEDRAALDRLLRAEADYLLTGPERGGHVGVVGNVWGHKGNAPENNLWNGAFLWRVAQMYPDAPHAADWMERAHLSLMNAISIPADADDETLVAGRAVRDWHVGANFFPHFALDHHSYMNVGYMTICVSNAALLHFDARAAGWEVPASLDHHLAELWAVLRRMVFGDARLARIGGDTRVRYAYCQEYLLPALLLAADRLGDAHARPLVEAQLDMIAAEADHNGDGTFYGRRLAELADRSPVYWPRLEVDRAMALAQLVVNGPLVRWPAPPAESFEASVAGGWAEPEHGGVMHRCPTRLASFSWRAQWLTQGLCLPPDDGSLAEWEQNLVSVVDFAHYSRSQGDGAQHRRLEGYHIAAFEGGFATCGSVMEGTNLSLYEGWTGSDSARHWIAFVALPDGHTVVGMERIVALGKRYVREVRGLHANLPNDVYNGFVRPIVTPAGAMTLHSPPPTDEAIPLGGRWVSLAGRIGLVGLWGADGMVLRRRAGREGGAGAWLASIFTEQFCFGLRPDMHAVEAGETILDLGWLALSSVDAETTAAVADDGAERLDAGHAELRALRVHGRDGKAYVAVANFGPEPVALADPAALLGENRHPLGHTGDAMVPPAQVRLWRVASE